MTRRERLARWYWRAMGGTDEGWDDATCEHRGQYLTTADRVLERLAELGRDVPEDWP
ncbi:MAG TPA: hypothetical protein VD926_00865 [Acidimicrobiales bacterium]|nr:hypothetical protein [Acidimicrobiales bacterium]